MTVFTGLADFRGCIMRSVVLDFADLSGDLMFVNVHVTGDMVLRQTTLRGSRNDFTGLRVDGRFDLAGAHIKAAQWHWADIGTAIMRASPDSRVLGMLAFSLKALDQTDEARDLQALLADKLIIERLKRPDIDIFERVKLHVERSLWGLTTGYGTQLGRILFLSLVVWLVSSIPLVVWPGLQIRRWAGTLETAPPRLLGADPAGLQGTAAGRLAHAGRALAFGAGLVFALPAIRWRAADRLPRGVTTWLAIMRGIGLILLTLLTLTLTQVSPVFQAIIGKVMG